MPRESWVSRSYHCSCPRPLSWHPQTRTRGRPALSFVSFFCLSRSLGFFAFVISLVRISSSWDRPGRRTADGETGQNARRYSLDRLHVSRLKYLGVDIRIGTGQEGIGNSSHGLRTEYRDRTTDTVGARLGSTHSAAPGNPGPSTGTDRESARRERQPWWSS